MTTGPAGIVLSEPERKKLLEDATTTGEQFQKIYYDTMDKRRQLVWKLYNDTAVMTWNGNVVNTSEGMRKFFEELPQSVYQINSLDAQPVSPLAVGNTKTILIQVSGIVIFRETSGKSSHPFNQSIIITAMDDKWKIVTDVFRTAKST